MYVAIKVRPYKVKLLYLYNSMNTYCIILKVTHFNKSVKQHTKNV